MQYAETILTKDKKETPVQWRDRVLNSKSKSFCGAKWYNATIWLGNGATSSCHLPPPHKIDENEIKDNPSAIHNTLYKKLVRKQMQEGERPKECEYCWKIEDMGSEYVSDRFFKSKQYSESDLQRAYDSPWDENVTLQTLEISFDSNCNFGCSYCNAGFSTTWAHDINKNGPYQDLVSDGWGAFAHNGSWAQPYGVKNEGNPYTQAFWKWWESDLQYSLKEIRVTGGEATVSIDFWKLVDWYNANPDSQVALAVNSNLGVKREPLNKLVELSHKIKTFNLFTSNESYGSHAEYIRHGLKWHEWYNNFEYAIEQGNFSNLHCMYTVNALCLASFDKIHDVMLDFRSRYPQRSIDFSYNMLRFPSFQALTTLPKHLRLDRAQLLENWHSKNSKFMNEWENEGLIRTIAYIKNIDEGHSYTQYSDLEKRQSDFYNFYNQYDRRRGLNFVETFKDWPDLVEWYQSLADNKNKKEISLTRGDATNLTEHIVADTLEDAKNKKLI